MTKLPVFDESKLLVNPYQYTLELPVTQIVSGIKFKKDASDGVIVNDTFVIEKIPSIKLYKCTSCKSFIYGLSDRAQRLYLYIVYNLEANKDYIQINEENYMNKNGIKSVNTLKEAQKELLRYSFISPTEFKSVYLINPNLFFNGNRLKKYARNIKIIETWEQ